MTDTHDQPGTRAVRAAGGCECGAVRYEVRGPLREVINCHCGQCRRTHGHFAAYSAAARADLAIVEDRGLKWDRSSDSARRGFCGGCGGGLLGGGRRELVRQALGGEGPRGMVRGTVMLPAFPPSAVHPVQHSHARWDAAGPTWAT